MITKVKPQILELEKMYFFPAGVIEFGVIYRKINEETLVPYEGRPGVAELLGKIRKENYSDQGVSIYVFQAGTKRDYLRFDCFEREPHYHYHHLHSLQDSGQEIIMNTQKIGSFAESVTMNGHWHQLPFDPIANGDIRAWAMDKLRNRLVPMLGQVGEADLAAKIDSEECAAAIDSLEPYVFGRLAD